MVRPASTFMSVVLPAPELPMSAVKTPGRNAPLQPDSSCSMLVPPTSTTRRLVASVCATEPTCMSQRHSTIISFSHY